MRAARSTYAYAIPRTRQHDVNGPRSDGQKIDKGTPGTYLRLAFHELGLAREGLRWYQATRHAFASQWVMNGGSIEKL